jgi:hypothetical protein
MTAPNLKSLSPANQRAHFAVLLSVCLVAVLAGALLSQRWQGQKALRTWREQRAAQGESFELTVLWPKPDETVRKFANNLFQATRQLPAELTAFSGRISAMVPDRPGEAKRGSQEPQPPGVAPKSWRQFDTAVSNATKELEHLRQLVKEAPASMGDDVLKRMDAIPDFVAARGGAQTIHAVAIHDLHRGNLNGALENLAALSSFVRVHADEPALVSYMTRVAILGLTIDAWWDALQAPGWTEEQLVQLQRAARIPPLLAQVPTVVQAERAARLASWEWFRSHSYNAWMDRHADLYKAFGMTLPDSQPALLHRQWQQWGFHPVWQFAWADQEELEYLEHSQAELAATREAAKLQSWRHLDERLKVIERDYRPPVARWRFHGRLPLHDDVFASIGSSLSASPSPEPACPHPVYQRAWQVTFKNLTLHQLVITAIALKRHELRHGNHPATLDALVPAFLPSLPRDFMDGQPLRYRRNDGGSFLLYSVGDDLQDDSGDPTPEASQRDDARHLWNGRDWVWPKLSAAERPGA